MLGHHLSYEDLSLVLYLRHVISPCCRAVTGLGIGLITPITTLYLREISVPELRGHLFIINCLFWNGGVPADNEGDI